MNEVSDYLKRVVKRTGFKREYFLEKNIPTINSNILAIPFFGNLRSTFIFSSFILNRIREENPSKYIILCSWPGMRNLFPNVDEYWTLEDDFLIKNLASSAEDFNNKSELMFETIRNLVEVLDIMTYKDIKFYYNQGFTKKYFEIFDDVKLFLPEIPSATSISQDLKNQIQNCKGKKIIVYPSMKLRSWQQGKTDNLTVQKGFWINLINKLLENGYSPIVYQNEFTYNMSIEFFDKCMYLTSKNISDVLSVFRYVGCVLDIHSGISKLALAARCSFLSVTERSIFIQEKDYEIDDMCSTNLPHQYIFSFSTQLMAGGPEDWDISVVENILNRLEKLIETIDVESLPSTRSSYNTVSYDVVRQRRSKRLGAAFINVSKRI
jgi:hypothetical protein